MYKVYCSIPFNLFLLNYSLEYYTSYSLSEYMAVVEWSICPHSFKGLIKKVAGVGGDATDLTPPPFRTVQNYLKVSEMCTLINQPNLKYLLQKLLYKRFNTV